MVTVWIQGQLVVNEGKTSTTTAVNITDDDLRRVEKKITLEMNVRATRLAHVSSCIID